MNNVRFVEQKTLTLGQPETIKLPTNDCIRNVILRLGGTVTIASGSASGSVLPQGASRLLSQIAIRRNGSDTPFALPGWLLYELNKIFFGTAPQAANLASGDAQSATAVNQTIVIPFENLGGVKPFDTLLKANGLSSLDLLVDTVAAANLTYGSDRTFTTPTTFTLRVSVEEERYVNNFSFGDLRVSLLQKIQVSAASTNFQIKPLPADNMYKGFLFFAEDTGVGSDTLVNKIKIKSGSESFVDGYWNDLKGFSKLRHQAETAMSTGAVYLNMIPDGMLNSALDLRQETGRQTLEAELDVAAPSGTAYVYVVGIQYVPPVQVKKITG